MDYKDYMKKVKTRLKNSVYGEDAIVEASLEYKVYYINGKPVTGEELYGYYKKVKDAVNDGETSGIGVILDEKIYAAMPSDAKERYVFELCRLYRDMKTEYLNRRKKNIPKINSSSF